MGTANEIIECEHLDCPLEPAHALQHIWKSSACALHWWRFPTHITKWIKIIMNCFCITQDHSSTEAQSRLRWSSGHDVAFFNISWPVAE